MFADSGDGKGLNIFRYMKKHSVLTDVAASEFLERRIQWKGIVQGVLRQSRAKLLLHEVLHILRKRPHVLKAIIGEFDDITGAGPSQRHDRTNAVFPDADRPRLSRRPSKDFQTSGHLS